MPSKKNILGMDDFFKKAGFHRHQHNYRGKGYYFSVGGYDITRADAIAIYKLHQSLIGDVSRGKLSHSEEYDNNKLEEMEKNNV